MANDTFALSPISARATVPGEEDYEAISEAFMETARGRWFLGEYARRNRNADTRMVLDAVERIEQSLAAQKIPEPEQVPDTGLADALSAIKAALDEARATADGAIADFALNTHLAPLRKGARVIREISWRWREIGADSRICDLIDSQVGAIESSCAKLALADPQPGLQAAFALIDRAVAAFDDDSAAEAMAGTGTAPSPDRDQVVAEAAFETQAVAETAIAEPAVAEPVIAEPAVATASAAHLAAATEPPVAIDDAPVEAAAAIAEDIATETAATMSDTATGAEMAGDAVAEVAPELADAQDQALLDMVAAEMGAPDLSDDSEYYQAALAEAEAAEMPAGAAAAAEAPIETTASAARDIDPPASTPLPGVSLDGAPEPSLVPAAMPAPEPSLGSTLIANGLVGKPAPVNDPLAALRRLSQVEKIALFS